MVPTTAQKTSKYTLHVSFFFPSHPGANAHHSIPGSSTSWTRSAEHLFMVELYPSGQSQSRHDWPRPIPRPRSSARYANRAPFPVALFFRYYRVLPTIHVLTHNPSLAPTGLCFSVPHGVRAPPSLKNVRPAYLSTQLPSTPLWQLSLMIMAGALRSMRKSRPSIKASSPQSTGA